MSRWARAARVVQIDQHTYLGMMVQKNYHQQQTDLTSNAVAGVEAQAGECLAASGAQETALGLRAGKG